MWRHAARLRCGPAGIAAVTGVPARTVSRILARHRVAPLAECDPITGSRDPSPSTSLPRRYERKRPGELVHIDVKKLGRIPDGGGWRVARPRCRRHGTTSERGIGFDYVHALVDDYTRLAYAEALPDEKGRTCRRFLTRAAEYFAAAGIPSIERVMSDNAMTYRRSNDFQDSRGRPGGRAAVHQTALPLDQRQGRTVQPNPADRVGLPPPLHLQHRPRLRPLNPGSSTTTMNETTEPSKASPRSAA